MWLVIIAAGFVLFSVTFVRYEIDIRRAREQLQRYPADVAVTEIGRVAFIDEGDGYPVLISHGIFGGYDQAYATLMDLVGNGYRRIAPARFGYTGSQVPSRPDPRNQARAFAGLLDHLGVGETFLITTSAGGAAGIQFAILYPERVRGLILVSSGMPSARVSREEIRGPLGPPDFMLHDFPMWFAVRHFGFVFDSMFGSTERPVGLYSTLLPVAPRREGIRVDETITNLDMAVNFDSYPVEAITAPILVVHARDDPMAKFAEVEKFIGRADPQTAVFETGGHLITGHRDEVSRRITLFIDRVVDGHERSD